MLEAFEASGSPAVVVDRLGDAVKNNASAERLLGPDLQIVKRRIVSMSRDATAALDRALHALIWASEGGALHPPVVLPRRQGRPILAYPTRLPAIARGAFSPGRACVLFVDLDARPKAPGEHLIKAFGLTPAEARLAARLIGEDSLETAAATLGVSVETARNEAQERLREHRHPSAGPACRAARPPGQILRLIAHLGHDAAAGISLAPTLAAYAELKGELPLSDGNLWIGYRDLRRLASPSV